MLYFKRIQWPVGFGAIRCSLPLILHRFFSVINYGGIHWSLSTFQPKPQLLANSIENRSAGSVYRPSLEKSVRRNIRRSATARSKFWESRQAKKSIGANLACIVT